MLVLFTESIIEGWWGGGRNLTMKHAGIIRHLNFLLLSDIFLFYFWQAQ